MSMRNDLIPLKTLFNALQKPLIYLPSSPAVEKYCGETTLVHSSEEIGLATFLTDTNLISTP